MTLILGLDPAYTTGWALSNNTHGVWILDAGDARLGDLHARIIDMHRQEGWRIGTIAYEDSSYGSHNPAIQASHNELRGIIKFAAITIGARTIALNPKTIKKFATNYGNATKQQMIAACKTILGITVKDDNEADAIWICELAKWQATHGEIIPPKAKAKRAAARRKKDPKFF